MDTPWTWLAIVLIPLRVNCLFGPIPLGETITGDWEVLIPLRVNCLFGHSFVSETYLVKGFGLNPSQGQLPLRTHPQGGDNEKRNSS